MAAGAPRGRGDLPAVVFPRRVECGARWHCPSKAAHTLVAHPIAVLQGVQGKAQPPLGIEIKFLVLANGTRLPFEEIQKT